MEPYVYDAEYYETGIGGFHAASRPVISAHFEKHFGRNPFGKILDFGCGSGFWGRYLSGRCGQLDGVDFSDALRGTERLALYRDFQQTDLGKPWQAAGRYDLVFSVEVIEHVENCQQFLANAFAALEPGGRLFLTTTTYFWTIFVLLIIYRRRTSMAALWEFTRGLFGSAEHRSRFVRRFWEFFTGHFHGFTCGQLRSLVRQAGFEEVRTEYLQIQQVVQVGYFNQPYNGPHPFIVGAAVPIIRAVCNLINWFCRVSNVYAPNVLVVAQKPRPA